MVYNHYTIILFTSLSPSLIFAYTNSNYHSQTDTIPYSEDDYTEAIQFIMNEAAIFDSYGKLIDIDFNKLYEKFGYSQELTKVESLVKNDSKKQLISTPSTLRANAGNCAIVAVQDTLGVASVSALLSGGIVGLLQKKAAGEIAKLILKVGVKNVAPAAAAASLIWSFGRCMWF
ncbi:hypothetical protein AT575_08980 [Streptococcus penaeicida]|uniref:Uncharacterized protein n=2 Tax=Streptococcus penaeicida TaxID=1765960 RepID=A0A2N8LAF9_9STRE|nr:hypothetical protein AT575_08980 [Streptococcus penaeicida]